VPNQPDRTRLGGGLAIPSPFGTFYAPNISPDPGDGIGKWSETDFVNAVMRGVSPGGKRIISRPFPTPPMRMPPCRTWRDLFAYLKTLPKVSGKVRDHDLPFPFNIRRNVGIWKLLFFDPKTVSPRPGATGGLESRGAYLVNSFGHLRRMPQPAQLSGRQSSREAAFCGRPQIRKGEGLGAQHFAEGHRRMERQGHRRFSLRMA